MMKLLERVRLAIGTQSYRSPRFRPASQHPAADIIATSFISRSEVCRLAAKG